MVETIFLSDDREGPVVATLISRRAEQPSGRAVLYVHGFADYFFQTHLADFYVSRGWDFYALDLHKYGRSLLPHQTPNLVRDLADYYPELDQAAARIRERDGNRTLVVNGHSTGGLIAAVWAHARRYDGVVDGLFLNSPFVEFNESWLVRRPLAAVVALLARVAPRLIVKRGIDPVYVESLHVDFRGGWEFDLAWKPLRGFPGRAGWIAAIRNAHRQLRAGLWIPVPVLVGASVRSFHGKGWHEFARRSDAILNVQDIARSAPQFGPHVTLVRFDGALHDLTLSAPDVRKQVFAELDRWLATLA